MTAMVLQTVQPLGQIAAVVRQQALATHVEDAAITHPVLGAMACRSAGRSIQTAAVVTQRREHAAVT